MGPVLACPLASLSNIVSRNDVAFRCDLYYTSSVVFEKLGLENVQHPGRRTLHAMALYGRLRCPPPPLQSERRYLISYFPCFLAIPTDVRIFKFVLISRMTNSMYEGGNSVCDRRVYPQPADCSISHQWLLLVSVEG